MHIIILKNYVSELGLEEGVEGIREVKREERKGMSECE